MQVPWSDRPWNRVAVYGLGISGRAAIALLRRHGVQVLVLDERSAEDLDLTPWEMDPEVDFALGSKEVTLPTGIDGVVISPGIPADRPILQAARQQGIPVIAEVEFAFAFLKGSVLGITGSNGKSTTTAMAGEMLRVAGHKVEVCGNIGDALSSRVEGEEGRIFVVELSSFQLEGIDRFHCSGAAFLNLSHDHLDRHADYESYRQAKAAIFRRQQPSDLAVLNASDPSWVDLPIVAHRRFFTSQEGTVVEDGCYLRHGAVWEKVPGREPTILFRTEDVPLPGPHNVENAMAAALLARHVGVEPEHMVVALRQFHGLPHRLEWVGERHGVQWYNDSKGTNLVATQRSLEGFADHTVHLILGGRYKGGDLSELSEWVVKKASRAYLIGESADVFAAALGQRADWQSVGTMENAIDYAAQAATGGEVVLLSPACSSFDQFTNFAERGRIFRQIVQGLDGMQTQRPVVQQSVEAVQAMEDTVHGA